MFTSNDLSIIYDPYFTVLSLDKDTCEITSNNTNHTWRLTPSLDGFYVLYHKHKSSDPYHIHAAYSTIENCLLDIASHDEFQLRGRKPAKWNPPDTFFNHILKTYQRESQDIR